MNQVASFALVLVEAGVVMASNPTVPGAVWAVVVGIFGIYLALRLLSRQYWIAAAERAA